MFFYRDSILQVFQRALDLLPLLMTPQTSSLFEGYPKFIEAISRFLSEILGHGLLCHFVTTLSQAGLHARSQDKFERFPLRPNGQIHKPA